MTIYNPTGTIAAALAFSASLRKAPRVLSASALTSTKVRLTFDGGMTKDNLLTDPSNYLFTVGSGADLLATAVVAEDETNPTYVDITTNEHTDGAVYTAEVNPLAGGPTGRFGMNVADGDNSAAFAGVGIPPTVASVEAVSANLVNVVFSEDMADNADIRDASNYSFSGGLSVISVLDVSGDTVQLVTSDQTPGTLYNLTITV